MKELLSMIGTLSMYKPFWMSCARLLMIVSMESISYVPCFHGYLHCLVTGKLSFSTEEL